MEAFPAIATSTLIGLTITRYILNNIVYRKEYDYHEFADMVSMDFSKEAVKKRDNAVVLMALSLFTFFWVNFKSENKTLVRFIHVTSLLFVALVAIYFLVI